MQAQSPREQELMKMAWEEGNAAAWKGEGWAENPYSKDLPGWTAAAGSNTRPTTVAPGEEPKKSLSQVRRQKEKDAVQWWNDQNKQRYQEVLASIGVRLPGLDGTRMALGRQGGQHLHDAAVQKCWW